MRRILIFIGLKLLGFLKLCYILLWLVPPCVVGAEIGRAKASILFDDPFTPGLLLWSTALVVTETLYICRDEGAADWKRAGNIAEEWKNK